MRTPILIRVFVLTVVALGLTSVAVGAETKQVYKPMGAPADPKVPAQWNRYLDHAQATELLKSLVAAHADRARLKSLGRSYAGREMWLLTVTNFKKGNDRRMPAFWIDGGIHANEIQGPQVALYTAWYLLEMYGRNEFITRLVDERAFYILPMMSPDSRDAHIYEPNTTSSPRSGQRPVDDDRDGLVDEDRPDDLDGDGQITQMRIRDPNGRYKPNADFPNVLERVETDQRGQYTLLGTEGFDNDGDGRVNEDGAGAYDPNRDWPSKWQPGYVQSGALRYPFSLQENRVAGDFVMDHPNIAGAQTYHNSGGWILRPPGNRDLILGSSDVAVYDSIGKKGEMMLPGYRYVDILTGLYEVYGGELDWFLEMQGVFAFCNELFTTVNYFRKPLEDSRVDVEKFNQYLLFNEGTVPWHAVDHPQYGKVEVGGLRKEWTRQPPSFLLEEECHRNMAFTLYHADQMPQVAVQSIEIKRLAADLSQVTAVVINKKPIPTHARADVEHKITRPDLVTIRGKDLAVVAGMTSDEPFFQNAREQKRRPEEIRVDAVPGMGAAYVRWLVRGKGPIIVRVDSVKGGAAQRTAKLP